MVLCCACFARKRAPLKLHHGQMIQVLFHFKEFHSPQKGKHQEEYTAISRQLLEKVCTGQSGKVIWDTINSLDTVAVEPTFAAFL